MGRTFSVIREKNLRFPLPGRGAAGAMCLEFSLAHTLLTIKMNRRFASLAFVFEIASSSIVVFTTESDPRRAWANSYGRYAFCLETTESCGNS